MVMTDEEIIRDFNQAKNKNAQIGILADLNTCDKQTIIDILLDNGAVSGVKSREKKAKKKPKKTGILWTEEMVQDLERYREQGLTYSQIAERIGVDTKQVSNKISHLARKTTQRAVTRSTPEPKPKHSTPVPANITSLLDCLLAIDLSKLDNPLSLREFVALIQYNKKSASAATDTDEA